MYLPSSGFSSRGTWPSTTSARVTTQITRWIDAIDRIDRMGVDLIVPGHGPIGTKAELKDTRAYLELITEGARRRYAMGMSPGRAAADIPLGRFAGWTNPERNAWNMSTEAPLPDPFCTTATRG